MESPSREPVLPTRWRVWCDDPADGAGNMALDLAMLHASRASHTAATGEPAALVRVYGWSAPTISFGRHERTAGRFDAASVAGAGLRAIRRPTGGRALLHDAEITYAVALPLSGGASWRDAYAQVNTLLLAALHALGVPAALATAGTPLRPDGPLCFDAPDAGEITVDGRKLVGSAVWREREAYLQHGSILITDQQARLRAAGIGPPSVDRSQAPPPAATLAPFVAHTRWRHVADRFTTALSAVTARIGDVTRAADGSSLRADALALRARFADPGWTWRH